MSKLSFCLVLLIARTCTSELNIDAIHHKRVDFLKIFSVFSWRVEGFGLPKGM
jgi:hypothetical protein